MIKKEFQIVKLGLKNKSTGEIIIYAYHVHDQLDTNKSVFIAPPVKLDEFKLHINDLFDAQKLMNDPNRQRTHDRDAKLKVVSNDLRLLTSYVQTESEGDANIIALAGMEMRSKAVRSAQIDAPIKMHSKATGNSGEVVLKWSAVANAKHYAIEWTVDVSQTDSWKPDYFSNGSRTILKNLTPGTTLWFRVCSLGAAGKSAYSAPLKVHIS